ncbi:MAG: hypothetical protein DPW16_12930 [Chloroflexi bacterium]|nr:hypothetical protein [Chloroflexota bacterium]
MPKLQLAFDLYSTGSYSDRDIARELNVRDYNSKTGRPFDADCVRAILQNRTYLGFVKYQQYDPHSDGPRSWKNPIEWIKGKHDPIIDEELFNRCQEIRYAKAQHHEYYPKYRFYLLRDVIYCAECVANMPDNVDGDAWGKMRCQSSTQGRNLYYRCRARDFGRECSQTYIRAENVEEQVINILKSLKPPTDWRDRMIEAMGELLGDNNLNERLTEIKQVIEHMDFRWDNGFITEKDEYLEQRVKLQQELEKLTPIPEDELRIAADVLENFEAHWDATKGDRKAQQDLINLIVARVWVKDGDVVAMSLRPNYHITVGLENTKSTELSLDTVDSPLLHRRKRRVHGWIQPSFLPQYPRQNLLYHFLVQQPSGFFQKSLGYGKSGLLHLGHPSDHQGQDAQVIGKRPSAPSKMVSVLSPPPAHASRYQDIPL